MENTIFLKDVLDQMKLRDANGFAVAFDIVVREFSIQNKTGGKLKTYNDARLLIQKPKSKQRSFKEDPLSFQKERKNPNHFSNHTRNLELANGEKKKINIRFIILFNGKKVVY